MEAGSTQENRSWAILGYDPKNFPWGIRKDCRKTTNIPVRAVGIWEKIRTWDLLNRNGWVTTRPTTVAARSKAWPVFSRSNAGIASSNLIQGMDVSIVYLFCVCVVSCVGRVLATSWSAVHGALPTACRTKKLKKRPRPTKGPQSHNNNNHQTETLDKHVSMRGVGTAIWSGEDVYHKTAPLKDMALYFWSAKHLLWNEVRL
jgi:hypothetical protein